MTWAAHRARVGRLGEFVAAGMLERHGVEIIDRNVEIGRGEIDIVARHHGTAIAVEVKTSTAVDEDHPRQRFTDAKRDQVSRLGAQRSIGRIDLVTVVLRGDGARVEWHRGV